MLGMLGMRCMLDQCMMIYDECPYGKCQPVVPQHRRA